MAFLYINPDDLLLLCEAATAPPNSFSNEENREIRKVYRRVQKSVDIQLVRLREVA